MNFRSTACPSLDRRREAFPCQRTLSQGSVTCSPFPTNISAPGNVARGDLPGKPPRITRDKVAFLFLLFIFFYFYLLGARIRFQTALGISKGINTVRLASIPRKIDCYEPDMGTFRMERSREATNLPQCGITARCR